MSLPPSALKSFAPLNTKDSRASRFSHRLKVAFLLLALYVSNIEATTSKTGSAYKSPKPLTSAEVYGNLALEGLKTEVTMNRATINEIRKTLGGAIEDQIDGRFPESVCFAKLETLFTRNPPPTPHKNDRDDDYGRRFAQYIDRIIRKLVEYANTYRLQNSTPTPRLVAASDKNSNPTVTQFTTDLPDNSLLQLSPSAAPSAVGPPKTPRSVKSQSDAADQSGVSYSVAGAEGGAESGATSSLDENGTVVETQQSSALKTPSSKSIKTRSAKSESTSEEESGPLLTPSEEKPETTKALDLLEDPSLSNEGSLVISVVLWSLCGIVLAFLVFGVAFYYLKYRAPPKSTPSEVQP